ncbi:MAG: hypothetical protein V1866_04460 [archaeon]
MFHGKEVRVLLKGEAKSILNSIERAKERLKENPQYGEPVPKRLIPKEYLKQGIQNLYRVELSNYWRMLYTIEGNEVEILLFILSITDHQKYDRLLGYD